MMLLSIVIDRKRKSTVPFKIMLIAEQIFKTGIKLYQIPVVGLMAGIRAKTTNIPVNGPRQDKASLTVFAKAETTLASATKKTTAVKIIKNNKK